MLLKPFQSIYAYMPKLGHLAILTSSKLGGIVGVLQGLGIILENIENPWHHENCLLGKKQSSLSIDRRQGEHSSCV